MSNSDANAGATYQALPVFDDHHGRPEVWSGLRIDGLVQNPTVLTEADLHAIAAQTLTDDFRCVEGWSVPGQVWEGAPLAALLELAGPQPEAAYAAVSAADFTVAIPLDGDVASVLLATGLNGAPLAPEHGGPCRLVSAGQACHASVKWVDRIRLTAHRPEETAAAIAGARNSARAGKGS